MTTILTIIFIAFMLGLIVGTLMERVTRQSILEHCAKGKTREKINGRFYYIVPEEDYVEMSCAAMVAAASQTREG